jgi:hypothetical protein
MWGWVKPGSDLPGIKASKKVMLPRLAIQIFSGENRMYLFFFVVVMLLAPIAARAECRPPEEVKVVNARIVNIEIGDASKFPSHHPDAYHATNFHLALPGCAGIPVVVREIEPLAPKCRNDQTISTKGTYMEFLIDKDHSIYVAAYPKEIICR